MNNGDMPVNVLKGMDGRLYNAEDSYLSQFKGTIGLTKREYFAAMAMQGALSNPDINLSFEKLAEVSVQQADALLKALEANDE